MELNQKIAELEALLFIHGEPLALKKARAILDVKPEELDSVVVELTHRLLDEGRGLALVSDGEKIQFVTKPQFGKILESFIKEELSEDLTPASLEALALIAYFAPISRSRLDYLRGVNSAFIVRSLLLRGLAERFPDPQRLNTFLYRPTFDLLRHLGLDKKEALPDYAKFQSLLRAFEAQQDAPPAEPASAEFVPPENKEDGQ